jgi:hypothetical protein
MVKSENKSSTSVATALASRLPIPAQFGRSKKGNLATSVIAPIASQKHAMSLEVQNIKPGIGVRG